MLVVTRRHVAGLADLSEEEGAAVGRGASLLAKALVRGGGATWVHAGVVGTHVPHFHLHLLPRYVEAPSEVAWHAVDEWDGARRGGAPEIASLAELLRGSLPIRERRSQGEVP